MPVIKEVGEEEGVLRDPVRNEVIFMRVIREFGRFDDYWEMVGARERNFGEYRGGRLSFSSIIYFVNRVMSK